MRVLYQPTEATPADWLEVDSADWASLGSFPLNALCVQGVVFEGPDHYSVEHVSAGVVRVAVWHDDPTDWPVGQRWARVWTFRDLTASADPRLGGAITPTHSQIVYAEAGIGVQIAAHYQNNPTITLQDWADFDPRRVAPLDGLWLSDASYKAHQTARATHGWREWTDGLDPSEIDSNGRLKQQRAQGRYEIPKGTRTYFHNAVALANGIHVADNENELALTAAGVVSEDCIVNHAGDACWTGTSPSNEPNSSAWPTTGVYRYQIDVSATGADLEFGLYDNGNGDLGHFGRVNAAITSDLQTFFQDQSGFTGTGLHMASITNPAWTSGAATDRFEVFIVGTRVTGHGDQTLTLDIGESDDFADGPWAEAPAGPPAGLRTLALTGAGI